MFFAGRAKTPAPTSSRQPSETPTHAPSTVPSQSFQPTVTKYAVEIQVKLDNDSSQTGWSISSGVDGTILIDRPPGYFTGNDTLTVVETVRLEAGEYIFTVIDPDGFCCIQGLGFYSLYSDGKLLLFRQGEFEESYSETFLLGDILQENDEAAPQLRGSITTSSHKQKRKRKHIDPESPE